MRTPLAALRAFKQSRWYKSVLWAGAVFLVYVLVGFFVLPPVIRSQLVKRLPAITKRQAAVRQVKFNPLVLSLTIRGLSLTEPDGQVFASWEELYVNFQLSSLFRLAWTFAEIGLKQPYGHIALSRDGRFNFANIFEDTAPPPPKPTKPGSMPKVNVWRLHIDEGSIVIDDDTHRLPLHREFKPINISLTNLTTRIGKGSIYSFLASSDSGRSFAWTGTMVVRPFESRGHFELVGGELPKWTAVVRDYARAEFEDGRLHIIADYALSAGTNGFDASVTNGAVDLTNFKLKDLNNNETVTAMPSLAVGPIDFDLRRQLLHVGELKIEGFTQTVRMEKDGTLDLLKLPDPPPPKPAATNAVPAAPGAPWTVSVDHLALSNAAISFIDLSRSNRFETTLKPIELNLKRFTTQPDSDASYDFSIATEAGEKISGNGSFCIVPLRSEGEIKLAGFTIPKYAPYYQDHLRGEVLAGNLSAGAQYHLAGASNNSIVTVSNAGVALSGFQLRAADTGETVVGIPSFSVERTEANLAERKVQVGLIKASGGSLLVRQTKDGRINLLDLLNPAAAKPPETNRPATPEEPWTVLLKEIAFDDYAIKVEDQKPAKPVSLTLDQLAFNVKGVSTVSNEPITAALSVRLNKSGAAEVSGTAKISPPNADLQVQVKDLDLRPLQPYLNEWVRLGIASGRFSAQGRARYALPGGGSPMLTFAGDLGITNLATTDMVLMKDLVKWDGLEIDGVDLALQPNRLQVREVKWHGLQATVIVGPDQRLNLKTLLPEKATNVPPASASLSTAAAPAASTAAKAPDFPLQLDTLALEKFGFHFEDESIDPRCGFDVQELSGTIQGLSSAPQGTAIVDLRGKVDAASPFSVSGKVNPLASDLTLDLAVAFTNTDLTSFTTYLEKYAGYPLNKGRLSMGLHYDINHKQLKAQNRFLIDHFTLGARNDSTNATHLPVKLAVALLKDRNGQISLDIPLSGRTDDPQFRIAPLVFKVVVNLMVKAATSPFSLLGALVGGGEELSFVDFEPGQAVIPQAEAQKLDKLVKALHERPALNLEIAGSFDREKDRAAVARAKLEQELRFLRRKELTATGNVLPGSETTELEPADRERLLQRLLTGLGTNQTLVLQARAAGPETNTTTAVTGEPPTGPNLRPSATNAAEVRLPKSGAKGARDLLFLAAAASSTTKTNPAPLQVPAAPAGAPLSPEQIEARLVAAIEVSAEEQLDLIKQRAQAVQAFILKSGQVAPERLLILTPKPTATSARGQARANLSLV